MKNGELIETPHRNSRKVATEASIGVLSVDHHSIVRAGLQLLLKSTPGLHPAGEAANGNEAVSSVARFHPSVILWEYLGKDCSVEYIPDLLASAPNSRVIILTGCYDAKEHRRAVIMGARGLIFKDQDTAILIRAIRHVHDGELWIDRALLYDVMGEVAQQKVKSPDELKIATVTARELEIITQIGEGLKNKQIAERLFISETTVRHHLTSIFCKLEVCDRLELVIYAYRHNLCRFLK